jgi:transposase
VLGLLQSFGHTVKFIAPQLVKSHVKRGKNDAADAEALCEAISRPMMRFMPVKMAEQQAALTLVGVCDRLIRDRTQSGTAFPLRHDQINNLFHLRRDRVPAGKYRAARGRAFAMWAGISGVAATA